MKTLSYPTSFLILFKGTGRLLSSLQYLAIKAPVLNENKSNILHTLRRDLIIFIYF